MLPPEAVKEMLDKGALTPHEARLLRRAGRFLTVRLAGRGNRNLYQDAETKSFWELKEGTVVRLVGVDEEGIAKEASSREAGGSTGYHRIERMEQSPGTFNDGAGEKNSDKFAGDDDGLLEEEAAVGMRPDRWHQEKPYNADEDPGLAQTAATEPFEEGDWVVDDDGEELQVVEDQTNEGVVEVEDSAGRTQKHPTPQGLEPKQQTTASAAGMRDNQAAESIDFSLIGLPDEVEGEQAASGSMRGDALGFLGELDVTDLAAVTHREEMDRIVAQGEMSRIAARALRRAGRFSAVSREMYQDTVTGELWTADGDLVSRAEVGKTASKKPEVRTAAWDTIESVLGRERGWVPEFRVSHDRGAAGIHLENPTADDVMDAIHAARRQGYRVVHVH